MATDTTAMDLDSQHNCSTCKTRMSSLLHDSHLVCVACCGRDCNMDNRCVECEGWSEEVMVNMYVTVSLLTPRVKLGRTKSPPLLLASRTSSRDSNVSQASAASAGVSEARVAELISQQLGQFCGLYAGLI